MRDFDLLRKETSFEKVDTHWLVTCVLELRRRSIAEG
jgi:hypothetical protein